jgi:hypothetical protein
MILTRLTSPKKGEKKLFPLKAQLCRLILGDPESTSGSECGIRSDFGKRIWIWNAIKKIGSVKSLP